MFNIARAHVALGYDFSFYLFCINYISSSNKFWQIYFYFYYCINLQDILYYAPT